MDQQKKFQEAVNKRPNVNCLDTHSKERNRKCAWNGSSRQNGETFFFYPSVLSSYLEPPPQAFSYIPSHISHAFSTNTTRTHTHTHTKRTQALVSPGSTVQHRPLSCRGQANSSNTAGALHGLGQRGRGRTNFPVLFFFSLPPTPSLLPMCWYMRTCPKKGVTGSGEKSHQRLVSRASIDTRLWKRLTRQDKETLQKWNTQWFFCITVAYCESKCRDVHSYLMRAVAPANPLRDVTTRTRSGPLHFISGLYKSIRREEVSYATWGAAYDKAALGWRISGAGEEGRWERSAVKEGWE